MNPEELRLLRDLERYIELRPEHDCGLCYWLSGDTERDHQRAAAKEASRVR